MPAGAINIRAVGATHYIVTGDRYATFYKKKLVHTGRQFLFGTCPARTGAVVATHKGQIIGFVLYDWCAGRKTLQTCGTWVHPDYRRHRVALRLWRRMIRATQPRALRCYTVTRKGHWFARHAASTLSRSNPRVRWEIIKAGP